MAMTPPDVAPGQPTVTLGEVLVLTAVVVLAAVAEAGLVLMHARSWTLGGTAALATVLVVLAGAVLARRRPRLTVAPLQLAVLGGVAALSLLFALPGFPVGMAGWDPGVYTNHALAIPRTGAYDIPDPAVDRDPELPTGTGDGARFPGTSYNGEGNGRAIVGFYHLYPSLLAPAAELQGERGTVNVNPFLGALVALALTLVGWRAFGPLVGGLVGVLAALNIVQVWHARLPTSEILTELLTVAALLGILLARQCGWRAMAGLAGVLTGLIFLARGDGFVILLLALGALGLLAATGRFDRRAAWYAAGLGITLPHSLLQAYDFAEHYTRSQGLPGGPKLIGIMALLAVGAGVAWRLRTTVIGATVDRVVDRLRTPSIQQRAGLALAAAFVVLVGVNYLRPLWAGERPIADVGASMPYYNARGMLRLTWFFSPVGIAAIVVGVAAIALRRWSFTRWIVVLPSLAVLPVYLADPRIGSRLLWWTRRFVPFAMPGLLLLTAVGLVALLLWSGRGRVFVRVVGAVATVFVVVSWWATSWPTRDHDELAGSFQIHQILVDVAEEQPAVWLWAKDGTPPGYTPSAGAFASTLLYRRGDPVSRFDEGDGPNYLADYETAFPDLPIFVVADGREPPAELAYVGLERIQEVDIHLPIWELTFTRPPTKTVAMPFLFTVWRVPGT